MSYTISYQEKALKEYESGIEWYRIQSENAAINFEIAVKEKLICFVPIRVYIKDLTNNFTKYHSKSTLTQLYT